MNIGQMARELVSALNNANTHPDSEAALVVAFARAVQRDTLERALQAVRDQRPWENTGDGEDLAYHRAIGHCEESIRYLIDTPAPEQDDLPPRSDDPLLNLVARATISLLDTRGQPDDRQRSSNIARALTMSFGDAEWTLNEADSAAFVAVIENPPEPNEVLKAAAKRYKAMTAHDPSVALAALSRELTLEGIPGKADREIPDDALLTLNMGWVRKLRALASSRSEATDPSVALSRIRRVLKYHRALGEVVPQLLPEADAALAAFEDIRAALALAKADSDAGDQH